MFRSSSFVYEFDHKSGDDEKEEDKNEQIKRNYEDYLDGEHICYHPDREEDTRSVRCRGVHHTVRDGQQQKL